MADALDSISGSLSGGALNGSGSGYSYSPSATATGGTSSNGMSGGSFQLGPVIGSRPGGVSSYLLPAAVAIAALVAWRILNR